MRALNRQYRGIDKTTDVLSFPQQSAESLKSTPALLLGDIVINLSKAQRQASEHRIPFSEELRRLIIHGLLHLVGYDHEKNRYQRRKMESKERELLRALAQN